MVCIKEPYRKNQTFLTDATRPYLYIKSAEHLLVLGLPAPGERCLEVGFPRSPRGDPFKVKGDSHGLVVTFVLMEHRFTNRSPETPPPLSLPTLAQAIPGVPLHSSLGTHAGDAAGLLTSVGRVGIYQGCRAAL